MNKRIGGSCLHIGSKPGESVYQARTGGDSFLVVSKDDYMLYLYQTEETMLCPSISAFEGEMNKPYFWSEASGMMYVLSEVSRCSFAHIEDSQDAMDILESMEAFLRTV